MGAEPDNSARSRVVSALQGEQSVTVLTDVDLGTGRADAVILLPSHGAAVLHVHRGPAAYHAGRFACSRIHGATCNPAAHALQLTYGLRRLVRQAWANEPWIHVVPALVLPDVVQPEPLGPWAYPQALITEEDYDDPLPVLLKALEDRGCDADLTGTRLPGRAQLAADGPGNDWVNSVAELLTDPHVRARATDPSLRVQTPQWNEDQQRILDNPALEKVVLAGVHGSGKTALALAKVRSWLSQDRRVAIVTSHPGVAAEWRAAFAHEPQETRPSFIGTVRDYLGSHQAGRTLTSEGTVVELETTTIGGRDLVTSLKEFNGPPLDADCVVMEGLSRLPLDIWRLVPETAEGVWGTILKRPGILPKNITDFPDGIALRHLPKINYRAAGDVIRVCVGQSKVRSGRGTPGRVRRVYVAEGGADVLEAAWNEEWRLITERSWLPEDIAVVDTSEAAVLQDVPLNLHRKDARHAKTFDEALSGDEVFTCAAPTLVGITKKVVVLAYTTLPERQIPYAPVYLDDALGQASDMIVVVTGPDMRLLPKSLSGVLTHEGARRTKAEIPASDGRDGPE